MARGGAPPGEGGGGQTWAGSDRLNGHFGNGNGIPQSGPAAQLPVTVAIIPKNSQEDVRVTLETFKGVDLINVRIFAEFAGPATARTGTKKGIALNVLRLPELAAALAEAERQAREMGLLDG